MRHAVLALLAVLAIAGCGAVEGDQPPDGAATAPTSVSEPSESPREVSKDERFGFDDTAEFDDGLIIEMAGTTTGRSKPHQRGAERTGGHLVIVSIRIENGTSEEFNADDVLITATYGNGVDAPLIIDETGELQSGFAGTIRVGEEAVATLGFAIPANAVGKVTYTVDPGDDLHDPVSFTGAVRPNR